MAFYFGKTREFGAEQPYSGGVFKIRLPFIHYGLEFPDWIQGAILSVVPMGITAVMMDTLGIPFELAIVFVVINNFLYLLHTHFGDPAVAGWITAGIPLYVGFLSGFPEGDARIQAMIALQLMVALIFLVMGVFKGADALIARVPHSIKAGILLGAAIAAIYNEFAATGRVWTMPTSILAGVAIAFFMMFSNTAAPLRQRYGFFRFVAQYGIAVPFAVVYILGIVIGEVQRPQLDWSFVKLPVGEILARYSIFAVGVPPVEMFIQALPLAFAAYIIAFGDIIVVSTLIKSANEARPDEHIPFSASRNSIIVAIRNFFEGLLMPFPGLAGPQWTGGQALVINRYINSRREDMDSYWGGATGIFWGMSIALLLGPVVSLFRPGINIGMSLTVMIQGFLCGYLAIEMLKERSTLEMGIAAIIGTILASKGAAWGLGVGIILWLLLEREWVSQKPALPADVSSDLN